MEKDIDKIPKNQDTEIVIRIDDFGGKRGLTIREFVKGERYTGFTKAGTRIPVEHFKQFKDAINSISEEEIMADLPEQESSGETSGKNENGEENASSGEKSSDGSGEIKEQAM